MQIVVMAALSAISGLLLGRLISLKVARWISGLGYAALGLAAVIAATAYVGMFHNFVVILWMFLALQVAALVLPFGIAARCRRR